MCFKPKKLIISTIIIVCAFFAAMINCEHKTKVDTEIITEQTETGHEKKSVNNKTKDNTEQGNIKTNLVSLGNFKLTAYCKCSLCCGKWASNRPNGIVYGAIGEELKEGYSIAVDPSVIPYKTEVFINGEVYKAQDCGGAIKGNEIDVYMEDHNDALIFGVQYAEVFKIMY